MKVEDNEYNVNECQCPGCPTFNDCMAQNVERLFCARGATECGPKASMCICSECSVWAQYSLGSYYFCMRGAAE